MLRWTPVSIDRFGEVDTRSRGSCTFRLASGAAASLKPGAASKFVNVLLGRDTNVSVEFFAAGVDTAGALAACTGRGEFATSAVAAAERISMAAHAELTHFA